MSVLNEISNTTISIQKQLRVHPIARQSIITGMHKHWTQWAADLVEVDDDVSGQNGQPNSNQIIHNGCVVQ